MKTINKFLELQKENNELKKTLELKNESLLFFLIELIFNFSLTMDEKIYIFRWHIDKKFSIQTVSKLFFSELKSFSFNYTFENMNNISKKYFNERFDNFNLYFLFEDFSNISNRELKNNPFFLAILERQFNLKLKITALDKNQKDLFQGYYTFEVYLNDKNITSKVNDRFFYSINEDMADGINITKKGTFTAIQI